MYPNSKDTAKIVEYEVPLQKKDNLLTALTYIRQHYDSSLGFRFDCRFKRCGLCGVTVNGKAKMACFTLFEENMIVGALNKLPIIRDLVIDRRWILPFLKKLSAFPQPQEMDNRSVIMPPSYQSPHGLLDCAECLCCLSECPKYIFGGDFAGPYVFVKLAQLHYHPSNTIDRAVQAKQLGIESCLDCRRCYCPYGVAIFKKAIMPLLNLDTKTG